MSNQNSALTHLQQLVFERRIRLRDFFVDFDPLHKHVIPASQFMRALGSAVPLPDVSVGWALPHYLHAPYGI